ncbi:DEAD/DEAH box helicase family protein, partial [Escherichia coli]|uniref:DEAD/DEAH box helicase family protein n=2 Tax=Bacteria TaxID=2 RepID=UPI00265BDDC6
HKLLFTEEDAKEIAFLSLQDLKGSKYFGGAYDKLQWVAKTQWDLLVIDEAHEGVDTEKTDVAFHQIQRNFTLHLSGTPFKALAKGKFSENQIYNWSYADEQAAKQDWLSSSEQENPYENLPQLNMFTYQ